jgi:hypothetical protein
MIGIDTVLRLLELVVLSGHIRGEQPVSAMVTAPVEAGKTTAVMKFAPMRDWWCLPTALPMESCGITGNQ